MAVFDNHENGVNLTSTCNEVESLQSKVIRFIGEDPEACLLKNGTGLADLPTTLLEEVFQWMSGYHLMKLGPQLEARGLDLEPIWQIHAESCGLYKRKTHRNPFKVGLISWKQIYFDEHFKQSFNYCAFEYKKFIPHRADDPKYTFRTALKRVRTVRYQAPPDTFTQCTTPDDLLELAPHVRTLNISYKQFHFMQKYPELIHALSHSLDTIQLHSLYTRGSLTVVRSILQIGKRLKSLDVNSCIWDEIMMNLLRLVSDQLGPAELAKIDAEKTEADVEAERKISQRCKMCQLNCKRESRSAKPHHVESLLVENQTVHPVSDAKFVTILHCWEYLKEFVHICNPLTTPKMEEDVISPLLEVLAYLAREHELVNVHLNGPYHMSVLNLLNKLTSSNAISPMSNISYNPVLHCSLKCRMPPKKWACTKKSREKSRGILSLDLSNVYCDAVLRPVIFKPLVDIVGRDKALKELSMQSCRQFPDSLIPLFKAISSAKRLVSLDITGNYIQRSAFGDLVEMVRCCKTLRRLIINYCELPTRSGYIAELADEVAKSQLTTISVTRNRLGEHGAQFVVDVLSKRAAGQPLQLIDVSQNCIKLDAVQSMCTQLLALRKTVSDTDMPMLQVLGIDDVLDTCPHEVNRLLAELSRRKLVQQLGSKNDMLMSARSFLSDSVAQM